METKQDEQDILISKSFMLEADENNNLKKSVMPEVNLTHEKSSHSNSVSSGGLTSSPDI